MTGGEPTRSWLESPVGALLAAACLVALGLALAVAGFALSSAAGTATSVVAVGPFVLAVRVLVRAFRGRMAMLGLWLGGFALLVALVITVASSLHFEAWDADGEQAVLRGDPLPPEATGSFFLPEGDPGISGIYRAFVEGSGSFSRVSGDDELSLFVLDGESSDGRYVATEVAIVAYRFRMPWNERTYPSVIGRCAGTATFEGGAWSLAFTDARCSAGNGRYPDDPRH